MQDWEVAHIPQLQRPAFFSMWLFFLRSIATHLQTTDSLFPSCQNSLFLNILQKHQVISKTCNWVRCAVLYIPLILNSNEQETAMGVSVTPFPDRCRNKCQLRKKPAKIAFVPAEAVDTACPRHCMHCFPRPKCAYEFQLAFECGFTMH